jgi:hypothetical protein
VTASVTPEQVLARFDRETQALIRTKVNMGVSLRLIGAEFGVDHRLLERLVSRRVQPRGQSSDTDTSEPSQTRQSSGSLNATPHGEAERARRQDLAQRVDRVLACIGVKPVSKTVSSPLPRFTPCEPTGGARGLRRGNDGVFKRRRKVQHRERMSTSDDWPE